MWGGGNLTRAIVIILIVQRLIVIRYVSNINACFIFYSSVNLYNYDDISLTLNRLLANQGLWKLDKDIAVKDLAWKLTELYKV